MAPGLVTLISYEEQERLLWPPGEQVQNFNRVDSVLSWKNFTLDTTEEENEWLTHLGVETYSRSLSDNLSQTTPPSLSEITKFVQDIRGVPGAENQS